MISILALLGEPNRIRLEGDLEAAPEMVAVCAPECKGSSDSVGGQLDRREFLAPHGPDGAGGFDIEGNIRVALPVLRNSAHSVGAAAIRGGGAVPVFQMSHAVVWAQDHLRRVVQVGQVRGVGKNVGDAEA